MWLRTFDECYVHFHKVTTKQPLRQNLCCRTYVSHHEIAWWLIWVWDVHESPQLKIVKEKHRLSCCGGILKLPDQFLCVRGAGALIRTSVTLSHWGGTEQGLCKYKSEEDEHEQCFRSSFEEVDITSYSIWPALFCMAAVLTGACMHVDKAANKVYICCYQMPPIML